jgi:hypothetical protein
MHWVHGSAGMQQSKAPQQLGWLAATLPQQNGNLLVPEGASQFIRDISRH